jgi:hypothetical protein
VWESNGNQPPAEFALRTLAVTASDVATWLTAIGTVGAVIVALWLARRSDSERLVLGSNLTDRQLEIYVVNTSDRPIHVRDADLHVGRWRPDVDDGLELLLSQQGRLPFRLDARDSLTLSASISYERSYLPDRLRQAWSKRLRLDRALYLVLTTGQGKVVHYRFPRAVLRELLDKAPR